MTKKIGVVGIPGKWSTEILADEIEAATGFRLIIDMNRVELRFSENSLLYKGINLCELDALIIKKISAKYSPNTLDRLELLRIPQAAGVQVFSPVENVLRLIDRLACTVTLQIADIPMPDTVVTEDLALAQSAVEEFGSAVFKPLYSTKARGMQIISADSEARQIKDEIRQFSNENPMMYIQKKVSLPGKDLGLVFLGGDYLGSYARVSNAESWNTTIHSGGRYGVYETASEFVDLAYKAQKLFGMDFTTVDLAITDDGPIIFEVSAFGGFRGAQQGIGINAAKMYVDYVLRGL